jgi:hypothetical protein
LPALNAKNNLNAFTSRVALSSPRGCFVVHVLLKSRVIVILAPMLLVVGSGCGTVTIETDDAELSDVLADIGGETRSGSDAAGADSAGDECITDFDCDGIKGRTPCNLPA